MTSQAHRRAVYGSIVVPRGLCPECQEWALIIKGRYACCGRAADLDQASSAKFERMSEGCHRKEIPPQDEQRRILAIQDNRCFYCGTVFGDVASAPGREPRMLRPTWDHVEPFAWQGNNQTLNFVASCSICNEIKGSKMFQSKEDARAYVWHRRKVKGWATATEMRPDSEFEVRA